MGKIAVLQILSTMDNSGLKKGTKEAESDVSKFLSKVSGIGPAFGPVGAAIAAAGIARGIYDAAKASDELIRSTGLAAAKLGTTTQALSALRFAAKYSGVEAETLDHAMQKFSINLGGVDEEGGKTSDALRNIGLDAKALATMSPDEALMQVIGAFQKLPDQASKSAAAMAIFGKQGVQLIPLLSKTTDEIKALTKDGMTLGMVFDDVASGKVIAMDHALGKVFDGFQGVSNEILIELAPALKDVAEAFLGVIKAVGGAKNIAQVFLDSSGITALLGAKEMLGKMGGMFDLSGGTRVTPVTAPEVAKADPAATRAALAATVMQGKVDDLTKDLNKQIATFGMTADEVKVWELAQAGASAKVLGTVTALSAQQKALEENKKVMDELKSSAKSMLEGAQTPLEKETAEIAKVIDMRKRQIITEEQFQKLMGKIGEDSKKTVDAAVGAKLTPKQEFDKRKAQLEKDLKEGTIGKSGFDAGMEDANKALTDAGKSLTAAQLTPLEAYIKRRKELLKGLEDQTIDKKQFNRGMEDAKKEFDDGVKGIVGDIETPQEKYLKRMQELQKNLASGTIDKKMFDKAHGKAFSDFQEGSGAKDPKFSGALQQGSAEARSQILKFTFGSSKDPFAEMTDNGRKMLSLTGSTDATLKSIDKKLKGSKDLPNDDW
jgi:hypothetical protein